MGMKCDGVELSENYQKNYRKFWKIELGNNFRKLFKCNKRIVKNKKN